jgi:FkbM family methyltransferase
MRALYAAADCYQVLRRGPYGARAWSIVWSFARLKLAAALTARRAPGAKVTTRAAGWRITGWGYPSLASHFEEKFIDLEYWLASSTPRPFIIDCGANVGTAVLFFKTLYPDAEIMAFEPDPNAFEALQANVRDNHLSSVATHHCAVGGSDGRASLFVGPAPPGVGQASLYAPGVPVATTEVEVVRVSRFIDRPVDLLKIDVEGAEMDVLRELAEAGKLGLVREMVIEYHHHMRPEEDRISELFELLEEAGFWYVVAVPKRVRYRRRMYQDILVYAYN